MITEIVTHGSPAHLDEVVAKIIFDEEGEEKFPGVSTATFRCTEDKERDDLEVLGARENVMLLGLGAELRNPRAVVVDEHVFDNDRSKRDDCAATLAAKLLGIEKEPRWQWVLEYVLRTDKRAPNKRKDPLDMAETVTRMQEQGKSLQEVVEWVRPSINAFIEEQNAFMQTPLIDLKDQKTLTIQKEECVLAVAESDERHLPKLLRYLGCQIVVIKNSSGQVQILTSNRLRLDMRDTIGILRVLELRAKGVKGPLPLWKRLHQEGAIREVPEWFWHRDARNILNGGRSRPLVPPTRLSLDQVVGAVQIGLQPDWFHPARKEKCEQGVCTSTRQNPCPWYQLGLFRCTAVRRQMHQSSP